MKARHVEDGEWTLTVTEFPLLGDQLTVMRWEPCYWEVRHSAMGQKICEAVRVNNVAPWIVTDDQGDDVDVDLVFWLIGHGVPDVIVDRMKQRHLI